MNAVQTGPMSAANALASLHLVAYFLMEGGTGAWQTHLDRAGDWLAQTGLCSVGNEAPRKTLTLMSEAEQLAMKMIIVSGSPFPAHYASFMGAHARPAAQSQNCS